MTAPEFKAGDEVRFEDWEKLHNRRFSDVLRLFDIAMSQVREAAPESWGFTVEAQIEGFKLSLVASPPAKSGGIGRGSAPVFSREKVQVVVMESPDLLSLKEEGGRVTVSTKRYLDKEWEAVNGRLREAGMRYVRENRRWEQA